MDERGLGPQPPLRDFLAGSDRRLGLFFCARGPSRRPPPSASLGPVTSPPDPSDAHFTLRVLEHLARADQAGQPLDFATLCAAFPAPADPVEAGRQAATLEREWRAWSAPDAPDASGAPAPQTFGPYELVRLLGRGGQGRVFEAHDPRVGRRVALKVLDQLAWEGAPHAGPPAALAREVEALARLDPAHVPGIAGILETGVHDGRAFIATRLVAGPTLRQLLATWRTQGAPPLAARLALGAELVAALGAAHARGIVHRDVKPANVLVEPAEAHGSLGRPVLVDFGLARAHDTAFNSGAHLTVTGETLGTPRYMAPERLVGRGHDDPRADVWALGVVLFELVALAAPFEGPTVEAIARRIEREPPPRLTRLRGERDGSFRRWRDLEALIERALEKAPAKRYADATALGDDLTRLLTGRPLAARPLGALGRAARWTARNRGAATIGALLVAIAAGAILAAWRIDHARDGERTARLEAQAHLLRSEADRAHLVLESNTPGRFAKARTHLAVARTTAPSDLPSTLDRAALFSDLARAWTGVDLVERPAPALGGLGIVKVAPGAKLAASHGLAKADRALQLEVAGLPGQGPAPATPALPPDVKNLLAAHANGLLFGTPRGALLIPFDGAAPLDVRWTPPSEAGASGERIPVEALAGTLAPDGARFAVHNGARWTLFRASDGTALVEGTASAPVDDLATFSPDGRWFAVRESPTSLFVIDADNRPARVSFDHPVLAALPLDGPHLGVVAIVARPQGLVISLWRAPVEGGPAGGRTELAALAGDSHPPPALALAGTFLAAATGAELVVVDVATRAERVRARIDRASAIEALVWSTPATAAPALEDLELYFHQRSTALRRWGFHAPLAWGQPVAAPAPRERALAVHSRREADADLAALELAGPGGQHLELPGRGPLLFAPDPPRADLRARGAAWTAAALVATVEADRIESAVAVWKADSSEPWDTFVVESEPGRGGLALAPDGTELVIVTGARRLLVRDVAQRATLFDLPLGFDTRAVRDVDHDGSVVRVTTPAATFAFDLAALRALLDQP